MSYVSLKDVVKVYKMGEVEIRAVDGISFDIEKGELVVITGPSGSGKTTVLNLLGGMDTCTEGEVIVADKNVSSVKTNDLVQYRRYDVGFVFQFYNLINNLTAGENVELSSQLCKESIPTNEILEKVGLSDRVDNFPSQLSGGEQQRVAIARALAKKPGLLLCDEPTGALDYETGKKVLELLQNFCNKEGMTVIIVTHNSAVAPIANRVVALKSGKVESIKINQSPKSVKDIEW